MSRARIGRWLGLLAVALTASPGVAQTYTWNTATTDNAWMNAGNWTGGPANTWPGLPAIPNGSSGGSTDLAIVGTFAFSAANGLGIDMGTAGGELDLGAIQFTSGSGNLQIGSASGAGTLLLNGATVNGVANVILANTSATNDLTIANTPAGTGVQTMGLRLGNADNVLLVNAGRTLTINDVISGAFFNSQPVASTIGVQGGGTVVLGNAFNAFTGAVSVTGGSTLSVAADGSFGQKVASSRVILNNGTLLASGSFTLDSSRPIVVGAPDTAGGAGTIAVASGQTLTYNGVIQNAGSQAEQLVKTGSGTLQLGGASTYTGGTTVSAGTLLVNGQTGTQSGTGTGAVTVNTGATLAGNGQAAGAVTVNTGGRVTGGQGTAAGEQLTLGGNLTLANNSTIRIAAGNGATANDTTLAGSSQLAVAGVLGRQTATDRVTIDIAFAAGGNLDLTGNTTYTRRVATYGSLSNLTPGTYDSSSGVFNVTSPSFGVDPGWTVLVGQNGSALDVVFTPVPEPGAILAVGLAGLGVAGLARRARRRGAATLS